MNDAVEALPPNIQERFKQQHEIAHARHNLHVYHDSHKHEDRHRKQLHINRAEGRPDRVGFLWSNYEDDKLVCAFKKGASISVLCKLHKRMTNGISSRLKSLNLL